MSGNPDHHSHFVYDGECLEQVPSSVQTCVMGGAPFLGLWEPEGHHQLAAGMPHFRSGTSPGHGEASPQAAAAPVCVAMSALTAAGMSYRVLLTGRSLASYQKTTL